MKHHTWNQQLRRVAVLLVAGAAVFLAPAAAQAHEREHRRNDRGRHGRVVPAPPPLRPHIQLQVPIAPPRHLSVHRHGDWDRYHRGSVYYAPHRHRHVVYHFPVETRHGVVLRPYYYCGDELFFVGTVHAPHVSLRIGF